MMLVFPWSGSQDLSPSRFFGWKLKNGPVTPDGKVIGKMRTVDGDGLSFMRYMYLDM